MFPSERTVRDTEQQFFSPSPFSIADGYLENRTTDIGDVTYQIPFFDRRETLLMSRCIRCHMESTRDTAWKWRSLVCEYNPVRPSILKKEEKKDAHLLEIIGSNRDGYIDAYGCEQKRYQRSGIVSSRELKNINLISF